MLQPPDKLPDDQRRAWQQAREAFNQAYRLQIQGDWAGAMAAYRRSIAHCPTAEAYTFLGSIYANLYLYEAAMAECQRAIALDPDFGNPYHDVGTYLLAQERWEEAIPWFQKALQARRFEARHYTHYHLGQICEKQGLWEAAMDHYSQALELAKDYQQARQALYTLYARQN